MFEASVTGNKLLIKDTNIHMSSRTNKPVKHDFSTSYVLPIVASGSDACQFYVVFHYTTFKEYVMIIVDSIGQCVCLRNKDDIAQQMSLPGRKNVTFLYKVCFLLYHYFFDEKNNLKIPNIDPSIAHASVYNQVNACLQHNKSFKINHAICACYKVRIVLDVVENDDETVKITLNGVF